MQKKQRTKLPFKRGVGEDVKGLLRMLVKQPASQRVNTFNTQRHGTIQAPGFLSLSKVAQSVAINKNDAKNLFQILPDMQLASSILISAILSPGDLTNIQAFLRIRNIDVDDNIAGAFIRKLDKFFTEDYRIKSILPDILEEVLIISGSYSLAILPQSSLDQAINSSDVSMESLRERVRPYVDSEGWYKPFGLLAPLNNNAQDGAVGEGSFVSLESLVNAPLTPTDKNKRDYTVSMESFTKQVNDAVKERNSWMRDFSTKTGAEVTPLGEFNLKGSVVINDNPELLKHPMLLERVRTARVRAMYASRGYGPSLEARAKQNAQTRVPTLDEVEKQIYPDRKYNNVPLMPILTANQVDTENFGHPVPLHLPAECVRPIHIPGNPTQHQGYLVLLDQNGNPLTISFRDDYYSDIRSSMGMGTSATSHLTTMTRRASEGYNVWNDFDTDQQAQTYWSVLEQNFKNSIRNGMVGGDYDISYSAEVALMMFARACSGKHTTMLYIPADLLIYIAFDYNEYGVGRSLTEDAKTLAVIRSIILFSTTISAVKNATGTKTLTLRLDETDEDPYGSVEQALNVYAETNRESFPLNQTHPVDLINSLQAAGLNVVVEGHRAFPEVAMSLEPREGTNKEISEDLDERLRKRHIQVFGLTPEIMEPKEGADFATQVVANNLMLLKRVVHYQQKFEPFLTDIVRTYVMNSAILMDELSEIVKSNKSRIDKVFKSKNANQSQDLLVRNYVVEILRNLYMELPRPEDNRQTKLAADCQTMDQQIDQAIGYFMGDDLFDASDENMQKVIEALPSARANLKAMLMRDWMNVNGYMPELTQMTTLTEDKSPALNLMDETSAYVGGVQEMIITYLERALDGYKRRLERKQALEGKEQEVGKGAGGVSDDTFGETSQTDDLTTPEQESPEDLLDDNQSEEPENPEDDEGDAGDENASAAEDESDDLDDLDDLPSDLT